MKYSHLWSYFSVSDRTKQRARCDICGQILSYKTTTSNLKKHLDRKHPTVTVSTSNILDETNSTATLTSVVLQSEQLETNRTSVTNNQSTMESFVTEIKISEVQKKRLDKSLLGIFTLDFQPFSVVENKGFSRFIQDLNPAYRLPNRKTISGSLLPAQYKQCLLKARQQLVSVESVCLTTDTWTSENMDSFLAITAHFINDDFKLKSLLLECSELPIAHTSINLAEAIRNITNKFHITEKVLAVVTDNASNICGAIKEELKWKHFGCFAHTLNLIVQDALKIIQKLHVKIKTIVTFFKKSHSSKQKLFTAQRNLGMETCRNVKQDVTVTRWNSTYYMLERFVALKDALQTSMALINTKDMPVLSEEEWMVSEELCVVLKPFEQITVKMSGDQYVTSSQVIVFIKGLNSICTKMLNEKFNPITIDVVTHLQKGLGTRFKNIEYNKTIALATLLDPRFKLSMFDNDDAVEMTKNNCIELMTKYWNEMNRQPAESSEQLLPVKDVSSEKFSIWEDLDNIIAAKKPTGDKTSAAIVEIDRYLEDNYVDRHQDPLLWWKQNHMLYPLISKIVKSRFNMLATSVPCERIFSKAGNLMNDRRRKLNSTAVQMVLFLHVNHNLISD